MYSFVGVPSCACFSRDQAIVAISMLAVLITLQVGGLIWRYRQLTAWKRVKRVRKP